ncbi:MAG: chemotaxis protein CheW [Lachnospiraceae bacterium]|nr:chemotaxis protein CheW [Lachnospiraceae bacterium]
MAEIKYVIFNLGEQKYGMKLARIQGIEQTYNILPAPMSVDSVKGIINLRNIILPIYDIKYRFNIEEELLDGNKQIMITEVAGMRIGFEVDHVIGIVAVPEEEIKVVPRVATNDNTNYLENIIRVNFAETNTSEIMISIDIDNLLSDEDLTYLREAAIIPEEEESEEDVAEDEEIEEFEEESEDEEAEEFEEEPEDEEVEEFEEESEDEEVEEFEEEPEDEEVEEIEEESEDEFEDEE